MAFTLGGCTFTISGGLLLFFIALRQCGVHVAVRYDLQFTLFLHGVTATGKKCAI